MSMHLHHPSLSLNGKRRGKVKFRNAEEARKARELASDWEQLKQKWAVPAKKEKRVGKIFEPLHTGGYKLTTPPGRESEKIPSLNAADMSPATKRDAPVYTGTKMLGIGTMHKSNAVPIFSDDDAKAISSMRR